MVQYTKSILHHIKGVKMIKNFNFYGFPQQNLTGSTILGEYDGHKIGVSQMLIAIENCVKFIKNHFNVKDKPYSYAIIALNIMQLRLNNKTHDKLTVEQLKCVVDVSHEIANLNSKSDIAKQENERTATELKMIIDFLDKLQKESQK